MILVTIIPRNNPRNGFEVVTRILLAKSDPKRLKECPRRLMLRRNT